MREDGGDLRDFASDFGFQTGHNFMCVLECKCLIQFKMLLNMQLAAQVLNAHIMDVEIVSRSHGAYAIKDVLMASFAGNRVNHHVTVGQNALDGFSDFA